MTEEAKLLAATSLLPVLSDLLEDCNFNRQFKHEANNIINSVRRFDRMMLKGTDTEVHEQQIFIQRGFRQWLEESFKEV